MDLNDLLETIRTKRRWIVGGVVAGLIVAALLSWTAPRTYSSTTQLFVSVTGTPDETAPLDADSFSQQRIVSYVQVLTGKELAQRVVDELRLPLTAEMLLEKVTATTLPGTVILEVEVVDSSPERAQAIAESLGRQFNARISELETPDGTTTPTVEIETLQPADFDQDPVSPGVRRNLMLGAALGLVLGLGLALLRGRLDRTVRGASDAQEATGAELIGRVFEDRSSSPGHVPAGLDGPSPTSEAYRAIRVNLRHADGGPRVVVVTSSLPGEGASTVAVNLSVSLARSGSRVMLVDGNLPRPRVARYLGLRTDGPGLTDVLAETAGLSDATQPWDGGNLTVLGAGPLPSDTDAVLDSGRMRTLLAVLRDSYDLVVIDTPPLLSVIDAAALTALADGCLLVARFGKTKRDDLAEAAATVQRVHATVLGVVLNRVPQESSGAAAGGRSYPADPDRISGPDEARARRNGRRGSHSADRVPASLQNWEKS